MKKQIYLILLTLLFSAPLQAALISVGNIDNIYTANEFLGSANPADCKTDDSCVFARAPDYFVDDAELATLATSDPANYSYVPNSPSAYIDLGFNGYDIYNGAGDDLVVFIVGNNTSFGLEVYDIDGKMVNKNTYSVAGDGSDTVYDNDGNWLCVNDANGDCAYALSSVFIDLGDTLAGDVAIGKLRILLGTDYRTPSGPAFSLAGGFYTTPVPLPLPAILFASGLGLLGWVGRRKTV